MRVQAERFRIDGDQLEACLQDGTKARTLAAWYQENAERDGIQATPSFLVNGKKVNIPSYRCNVGDVIEVREKSRTMALVLEALESAERELPDYISVDPKGMQATFARVPSFDEVPYPVVMEPNLVVEFYSR